MSSRSPKVCPETVESAPLEKDSLGNGSLSGQGSAEFEYRVLLTNQGSNIIHETSKVVDRTVGSR